MAVPAVRFPLTSDLCILTSFPEPRTLNPFPLSYRRISIPPTAHPTGFKKLPCRARRPQDVVQRLSFGFCRGSSQK